MAYNNRRMTVVASPVEISLVSPFPIAWLPNAWKWINEYPSRNLDDYGPHTFAEFEADMYNRRESGELTWCVCKNAWPCGIIGYKPWTRTHGVFHGICFTQAAWGRETTMTAVRMVLDQLFDSAVEKVAAFHFADNQKINRFLRDLGAVQEGYLEKQALRNGELIDMVLLALFRDQKQGWEKVCQ